MNRILHGDCTKLLQDVADESVHTIISDIPYGISYDEWDVLHNNTNSALLGSSDAQKKAGAVFKHRGKPLNGWSEADRQIAREYQEWCQKWAADWLRVLKTGSSVFIFAGRRMAHRCICAMEDAGFIFKDMIAWEKEQAPHRAQRISVVYSRRGDKKQADKWLGWRVGNLRPVFEPILWFMKPYKIGGTLADNVRDYEVGAFNNELWKRYTPDSANIIKVQTEKSDHGLHPAQKPVSLLKALIELTTVEGQIVLDPFCGSGSTLVAAKQLHRNYIGMEANGEFVEIAKKRLLAFDNESVISMNVDSQSHTISLFA